ncbi:hypothetical protein BT96DRAFT_356029 [Gymnopus androsaceus JB14]|uniref:Uncharacterized protein n=1 Tax=Gymnopus androsaceus JB14 TaxID=1447944 RepID=A0A6A4GXI9_9AGAR|nr:hypothetical protein BT96DRAFT_356029 [Gymnopus androsaceus JB14]
MTQLWNPRPWIRWIILEIQNAHPIFQLLSALAVLIVISELFTPTDKTPRIVRISVSLSCYPWVSRLHSSTCSSVASALSMKRT